MEIVVMARASVIDGKIDEAREAFMQAVRDTHKEPGCIRYALHRGTEETNVLVMIERWTSIDALREHLEARHIQKLFAAVGPLLEKPAEILVLEPLTDTLGEKGRVG